MIMTLTNSDIRFPAEWEPVGAVLVAWPHKDSDWNYMLDEAEECYVGLINAIVRHAKVIVIAPDIEIPRQRLAHVPPSKIVFFSVPTNDTWTRDYGVITTVADNGAYLLNDFAFNAWGGKFNSDLDNGVTAAMVASSLLRGKYNDCLDFVLEGGSIESDGKGTVLTTSSCLLTPTRNAGYSRSDIEKRLALSLGATNILWLDRGDILGDDTDGHIDTIARFAPNDTILYCSSVWGGDDEQSRALKGVGDCLASFKNSDGQPFNLVELPMPDPVCDAFDGHRLPATYANFLILNDAVLMPVYGQPAGDRNAMLALQVAFPNHIIEPVDCRALIRQHGSLHCATMQLPDQILPF